MYKRQILDNKNNFIQTTVGWILKKNAKPINFKTKHFLDNVRLYLNTKYLWGGNSPKGIDCSALVQELLKFNNIYCPRDSKDQKKFFKKEITIKNIRKGDLLFGFLYRLQFLEIILYVFFLLSKCKSLASMKPLYLS